MTTMQNTQRSRTYELVIDALFIALTLTATWLINIRLPLVGSGGLIHLGNVPLFVGAMLYGRKTGAIAGAFGMGLFDLMSGWTAWAPFTFLIVGLMGYTVGLIAEKKPFKSMICRSHSVWKLDHTPGIDSGKRHPGWLCRFPGSFIHTADSKVRKIKQKR